MMEQCDTINHSIKSVIVRKISNSTVSKHEPGRTVLLPVLSACRYLSCIRKQHWYQSEVQTALLDELILDL